MDSPSRFTRAGKRNVYGRTAGVLVVHCVYGDVFRSAKPGDFAIQSRIVRSGDDEPPSFQQLRRKRLPQQCQPWNGFHFRRDLRRGHRQAGAVGQELFDFPKGDRSAAGDQTVRAVQFYKKGKIGHVPPPCYRFSQ